MQFEVSAVNVHGIALDEKILLVGLPWQEHLGALLRQEGIKPGIGDAGLDLVGRKVLGLAGGIMHLQVQNDDVLLVVVPGFQALNASMMI